jgi:hypothetical protein
MQALFDNIDAISHCVDRRAFAKAEQMLIRHDAMVNAAFLKQTDFDSTARTELLQRQRLLSLKFASLQADTGQHIEDLQRGRAAARRYLAELAS